MNSISELRVRMPKKYPGGFRKSTKNVGTKDRNLGAYSIKLRGEAVFICEVFQEAG